MTELKTLKDLRGFVVCRFCNLDNEYEPEFTQKGEEAKVMGTYVESEKLRQEAIKRYKHWEAISKSPHDMNTLVNYMQIWGRMAELKEFFNLTEEELK